MRTILRVLEETRRKIFDNIKKNSRIHNDTLRNRTTLKTDTLEIYSRREKRETRSNVTSSSPTCPPPLPTPPIQRWHLDRRILRSSNHQRKKKRKKNSATCLNSGKGNEISKRGAKEAGGTRWKNRSVAFAVRPRRWQHLTKRSRVADGGRTRIDGRVFVVFPFLFFSLAYLPLSPSQPCNTLRPTLSHGKRSLYSLVVGRLG